MATATLSQPPSFLKIRERGLDISGQRSKPMDEVVGERFDFVVTVCDNARESCPVFPGDSERIHWSIADPAAVAGEERQRRDAFKKAANELTTRIRYLLALLEKKKG
ncbi:MAG: arsenate reductase ArsC [Acidobacteria bacterium]|nr:arsenate reductase ArsC [Acidobacteriota bacterium]